MNGEAVTTKKNKTEEAEEFNSLAESKNFRSERGEPVNERS